MPTSFGDEGILHHMRRHAARPALGDECAGIVGLVGTERRLLFDMAADDLECGLSLGGAVRLREPAANDQTRTVLHQQAFRVDAVEGMEEHGARHSRSAGSRAADDPRAPAPRYPHRRIAAPSARPSRAKCNRIIQLYNRFYIWILSARCGFKFNKENILKTISYMKFTIVNKFGQPVDSMSFPSYQSTRRLE